MLHFIIYQFLLLSCNPTAKLQQMKLSIRSTIILVWGTSAPGVQVAVLCQPAWYLLKLNHAEQALDRHKYGNHYRHNLLLELYDLQKK